MFDLIVIGAGPMGGGAARHAAAAGARVCVVDPGEPAEAGRHDGPFASSHDAGRITRALDPSPVWARLAMGALGRYRALEARTGVRFYAEVGVLMTGGEDGDFLRNVAATARALGLAHRRLDPAALNAASAYAFPAGVAGHAARTDAGHIDPRAQKRAQLRAAELDGAATRRGEVVALDERRGRVVATLGDGSRIEAARAILAAGPHASLQRLAGPLPVRVVRRTVALADVDAAGARRLGDLPSLIHLPPGETRDVYVLPPIRYPDGRTYVKIGGDPRDVELTEDAALRDWMRGPGDPAVRDHLMDALLRLLPGLAVREVVSKPCALSLTPSGLPLIRAASDRITVLAGGNGAAAKSGDEIGRLGAALAMGRADRGAWPAAFDGAEAEGTGAHDFVPG